MADTDNKPTSAQPIVSPPATPLETQLLTPGTAAAGEIIQQQASSQDYVILRLAVVGLIVTIVVSLIGVILLTWQSKELPDGVIAMGAAAVGSLSTMLVRPPLTPPTYSRNGG